MYICFVCGKPVEEHDEFIWHGLDGDKIHKKCEKNLQKAYNHINNMTDEEFGKYLLGEQKIDFKRRYYEGSWTLC